ncbi:MAG: hypothetical protein KC425_19300, partial [Anaerolineales bacterium]|nr:hypothetical protein [Anaerolineales bacterium]
GPAAELAAQVQQIQAQFAELETKAQLSRVYQAIGDLDEHLLEYPLRLEKLRDRGYVHSGHLEDALEAVDDKWDAVRPQVEKTLQTHVQRLDRELEQVERQIDRLQPKEASVRLGESLLKTLTQRIDAVYSAVEGLYDGLSTELSGIGQTLYRLERILTLIEASPNLQMRSGEGPLAAVEAEWQRDGDEGPEGVLVLTDLRLLFEQREEVVTKRRFGLFKAESEMLQELHIDVNVGEIEAVVAKEEGGFLGMGKDDILELVLAATAPVSRARFHLKGQDSEDWAVLIRKAQSGEVDAERADAYADELAPLAETAAAFPTACPNCLAAVAPPARGISSVTCEFCGAVITPQTAPG